MAVSDGTCWEEHRTGVCGIGVPVEGRDGGTMATIGVAAPAWRLNAGNWQPLLTEAQEVAAEINRALTG